LHLKVNDDGTVSPLSTQGKILIDAFWLNDPERVRYRDEVLRDFRYFRDRLAEPEAAALFKSKFGFPDNLPDLRKNKPRRNSRPEGIRRSYYARRQRGRLLDTYWWCSDKLGSIIQVQRTEGRLFESYGVTFDVADSRAFRIPSWMRNKERQTRADNEQNDRQLSFSATLNIESMETSWRHQLASISNNEGFFFAQDIQSCD
jgi:hypothetical protein